MSDDPLSLMALFAAGGTIYAWRRSRCPSTRCWCQLRWHRLIPLVAAGNRTARRAGIGTLGSTINPFATVIAANAAGIPLPA